MNPTNGITAYIAWYLSGFILLMLCNIYLFGKKGEVTKQDLGMSIYYSIFCGHVFALILFLSWLMDDTPQNKNSEA